MEVCIDLKNGWQATRICADIWRLAEVCPAATIIKYMPREILGRQIMKANTASSLIKSNAV